MKDIRVNKSRINLNRIKLSFYEINFKFFSKILNKYKNNDCVNFLISQKIPLIFFSKSNDNESVLKSISEIIDILNRKEKKQVEKKDSVEEKDTQSVTNINQEFPSYSQSNIDNTYNSPSLTYKYSSKNSKIVQAIESVVDKIKKNIQSSKKKNKDEKLLEEKESKVNLHSKTQEIESNKINLLEKNIKNEKNIIKEKISSDEKINSKNVKEDTENLINETFKKRKIDSENIKKITSRFKKINEDIIKKNISSIKINKINYDFISKDKRISKNIYDKVNKTLFSIINKNNRIKHFSEISKSIIILDKKFGTKNIVNGLNEIIKSRNLKYNVKHSFNKYAIIREEDKIEKIHHYSKTADYKSLLNSISSFNSFISKNNFLSEESYNNLRKSFYERKRIKRYISEKNLEDKINYYKIRNNILSNQYKSRRETEETEKIHHYSKTADYKSLLNSISSFNSFISKNNFSNLIVENLFDVKKNKISKLSQSLRKFSELLLYKSKKVDIISSKKENYFHKIIYKYLNLYSKSNLNEFNFKKNNNFSFNIKKNLILDSIENLSKKINKNYSESYVYSDKNIVYRNKVDIKKIIDDSIEKIVDVKMKTKFKEPQKVVHYNEKAPNFFQKFQKKEKAKNTSESITKKEVDKMIQSYIESINFQKISERAVMSVEDKIRMERYRNGLI